MNLTDKSFYYRLIDISGNLTDPRMVSENTQQWIFNQGEFKVKNLDTNLCSVFNRIDPKNNNNLKIKNFETYSCVNSSNFNLSLDIVNSQATYLNIFIGSCVNSTKNNNNCYPSEVIKQKLDKSNFFFDYYFPSFNVDHYNIYSPMQETLYQTVKRIYPNMFYTYNEMIKVVEYTSDYEIMFEQLETITMFGKDPISNHEISNSITNSFIPGSFSVFRIVLNSNLDKFRRNFTKLQFVISSIGGIIEFVWIITTSLLKFITTQMLEIELSNYFIYHDDC